MGKKQSSLQRYEKKSNYSPIWKKIFLKGRILRIKRAAPNGCSPLDLVYLLIFVRLRLPEGRTAK